MALVSEGGGRLGVGWFLLGHLRAHSLYIFSSHHTLWLYPIPCEIFPCKMVVESDKQRHGYSIFCAACQLQCLTTSKHPFVPAKVQLPREGGHPASYLSTRGARRLGSPLHSASPHPCTLPPLR